MLHITQHLRAPGVLLRPISYSATIVRKYDYENFLCSLFLPDHHRNFVFALRAFNVELAQIRDRVSSAEQANIRFQFWKDVIENLSNPIQIYGSPVERELKQATANLQLSKLHFTRLINARRRHFEECSFVSMQAAQQYAEDTNSPIHYLVSEAYDLRSIQFHHVLNHLGRAQGLMVLLRSAVPLARRRRVLLLPLDLLRKHDISQETLLRALRQTVAEQPTLNAHAVDVFYDLACVAREEAVTAVSLAAELVKSATASQPPPASSSQSTSADLDARHLIPRLVLPAASVFDYLRRLERMAQFDPRHPTLELANGLLPLRLAWTAWRHRLPSF